LEVVEGAEEKDGWLLLKSDPGAEAVAAIGDYPTVVWALGKSVGDDIQFTDDKGRKFSVRIVGMINSSILQGNLVISEEQFVERFPSEAGYRMFLIDVPAERGEAVSRGLSRALRDFGLEVRPAAEHLAGFAAVENTYLSIFQLLGGLGVILGSIGLGLVVLRNVLERRGELAMLRAVGFDKRGLKKMVMYEHIGLVAAGLVLGTGAALIAVWPALAASRSEAPYFSLGVTIAVIAVSGILWIWLATGAALSGDMLAALRNE
jgi:ABC-type antimicrobial peptide transport system permease subunit